MVNTDIKANSREYRMPKLSFGVQTIAMVVAVASAVLLPQLLHMLGAAIGAGSALGEIFLPMHLPVLMVGMLAGPFAGAAAGLLSPVISYLLTGMPSMALLPFMTIELLVYGLCIGLMRNTKMYTIGKVFIAQIAGRAVRALAIVLAVYVFETSAIAPSIILSSVRKGAWGIIIQLVLIPVIAYMVRKADDDDGQLK